MVSLSIFSESICWVHNYMVPVPLGVWTVTTSLPQNWASQRRLGDMERQWIRDLDFDSMFDVGLIPRGERRIAPEVVDSLISMGRSQVKRREVIEGTLAVLARKDALEETLWAGRHILLTISSGDVELDATAAYPRRLRQLREARQELLP